LANGLYELGLAATQQGELDRATAYFERILSDAPNYPALDKVLYELAWNHQDNADAATASKYFQQLTQQFPSSEYNPEALYMLAQHQYDSEQFDQAAATYARVLERTQDADLLEKSQYKLGWSLFQQKLYPQAATKFAQQAQKFPTGPLAVDGLFMNAECAFKQEQYEQALTGYQSARQSLETSISSAATEQVRALIYLHGAQCYRELARWDQCAAWLNVIMQKYPKSPYLWTAVYELGYCKQKQQDVAGALKYYSEVVDNNRNEIGARARFMMGEVYFSQRDFRRAIEEFTRVAYGFGGDKAPDDIKNWQAKSAFEAARCYEVLVTDLRGDSRGKAVEGAKKFYEEIVREHAEHELASKASTRLGELQKLR
jgi:TolA-binding protein